MNTLAHLKTFFRMRWPIIIAALLCLCTIKIQTVLVGLGLLVIYTMLTDFRSRFWLEMKTMADEDRPE